MQVSAVLPSVGTMGFAVSLAAGVCACWVGNKIRSTQRYWQVRWGVVHLRGAMLLQISWRAVGGTGVQSSRHHGARSTLWDVAKWGTIL